METVLFSLLETGWLVTALSVDAFVASFSYGANHIRIPLRSVAFISGICSGMLGVSLLVGRVLAPYLPEGSLPVLCFLLLAGLGIVKIFDSSLKALIRRHRDLHKEWQFSAFHLRVILNIYANPEQARQDRSGSLSLGEAAALARGPVPGQPDGGHRGWPGADACGRGGAPLLPDGGGGHPPGPLVGGPDDKRDTDGSVLGQRCDAAGAGRGKLM